MSKNFFKYSGLYDFEYGGENNRCYDEFELIEICDNYYIVKAKYIDKNIKIYKHESFIAYDTKEPFTIILPFWAIIKYNLYEEEKKVFIPKHILRKNLTNFPFYGIVNKK